MTIIIRRERRQLRRRVARSLYGRGNLYEIDPDLVWRSRDVMEKLVNLSRADEHMRRTARLNRKLALELVL